MVKESVVKQLMEIVDKQTIKILELKNEIQNLKDLSSTDEELFYKKYQKVKAENLALQEKLANLEITLSVTNYELEKRNKMDFRARQLQGN